MPYPINQRAHQFNSIQSVPVSFGLWDTALKFLSPGPRNDVTDHLAGVDRLLRPGGGEVQFSMRLDFGRSILKMDKMRGGSIRLRYRAGLLCKSC